MFTENLFVPKLDSGNFMTFRYFWDVAVTTKRKSNDIRHRFFAQKSHKFFPLYFLHKFRIFRIFVLRVYGGTVSLSGINKKLRCKQIPWIQVFTDFYSFLVALLRFIIFHVQLTFESGLSTEATVLIVLCRRLTNAVLFWWRGTTTTRQNDY